MSFVYGPGIKIVMRVARVLRGPLKVETLSAVDGPCVYITRHLYGYGPHAVLLNMPRTMRAWALYKLTVFEEGIKHQRDFTCRVKLKLGPRLSAFVGRILAWVIYRSYRAIGALTVYRGERDIIKTMRDSLEALEAGDNLLIVPDVAYEDASALSGAFYTGFVRLGRDYARKTGKALAFVPLYPSRYRHTIYAGRPIYYDASAELYQEKERVVSALKASLDEMATACGDVERQKHPQATVRSEKRARKMQRRIAKYRKEGMEEPVE